MIQSSYLVKAKTIMRKTGLIFIIPLVLLLSLSITFAQNTGEESNKKIVILGSSVASGWVTSFEEKYDFRNGYAYRLERFLLTKGLQLSTKVFPEITQKMPWMQPMQVN